MTSRIEAGATIWRTALRDFRRAATTLMYAFRENENKCFDKFKDLLEELDKDLVEFLRLEGDNDRINVMIKSQKEHLEPVTIEDCLALVKGQITNVIQEFKKDVDTRSKDLDASKGNLQKHKDAIENLVKGLESNFNLTDPPDFSASAHALANMFQFQDYPWPEIDRAGTLFSGACYLATSLDQLKKFQPPPILDEDQVMIMKLNKKIEDLEKQLKEKDDRIKALNAEKIQLKTANIRFKNENAALVKQDEDMQKRLRISQNRLQDLPTLKGGLEEIAAIVNAPPRTAEPDTKQ